VVYKNPRLRGEYRVIAYKFLPCLGWKFTCSVGLKLKRNVDRIIVSSIAMDVE
jgi:hypothetical protein